MPRLIRLSVRFAVAATFATVVSARAVDVTTCGQSVPDGQTGVLQADLDCSGAPDGVSLGNGAVLDLNGHRLTAPPSSPFPPERAAIACRTGGVVCRDVGALSVCRGRGRCTVVSRTGRGEIAGSTAGGSGVGRGIYADNLVTVTNVDIHDVSRGIYAHGRARAEDVSISSCFIEGILARHVDLTNVESNLNGGEGIRCIDSPSRRSHVRGSNVIANANRFGGIVCGRVKLAGLHAQGNGAAFGLLGAGVYAVRGIVLTDSVVVGNWYDFGELVDLVSARLPRLVNTTCGHSERFTESGEDIGSWGVCADD